MTRATGGTVTPMPSDTALVDLPTWLLIDLEVHDDDETCTMPGCTRRGEWIATCRTCGARHPVLPNGRRPIACSKHRRMGDRRARALDRALRRVGRRYICARCAVPLVPLRWIHS